MSNKELKVGIASAEDVKAYLLKVARGQVPAVKSLPKIWFESFNSFSQLLSDDNQALLALIEAKGPQSFAELESLSGRKQSSLSRTLKKMEAAGIVKLKKGQGKALIPVVLFGCDQIQIKTYHGLDDILGKSKSTGKPTVKECATSRQPMFQSTPSF